MLFIAGVVIGAMIMGVMLSPMVSLWYRMETVNRKKDNSWLRDLIQGKQPTNMPLWAEEIINGTD